MIPVRMAEEPLEFESLVRTPGNLFLRQVPNPTQPQWKAHNYWTRILPKMRVLYNRVCAYCAHWIPASTGADEVDHFLPKSQYPMVAFEWSNYRYASKRFNNRKGTHSILDPFEVEDRWFFLDFDTFLIKPSPKLNQQLQNRIWHAIRILKLNDDRDLVHERESYFRCYKANEGAEQFEYLKKIAPFIAYEAERQGLVTSSKITSEDE